MPSTPTADSVAEDARCLLAALVARPIIDDQHVQRLRIFAYRCGKIDRRFAAQLFLANREASLQSQDWTELYLELLTGFFLEDQEGQDCLSREKEALILSWLGAEPSSIRSLAERRLALRVLLRASRGAPLLEQRIYMAVMENLLHQRERWLWNGARRPGEIDAMDIWLIRNLIDRRSAGGVFKISCATITFLLAIEQHASRFADPISWQQLFVKSLLRHLDPVRWNQVDVTKGAGLAASLALLLDPETHRTFGTVMGISSDEATRERLIQKILSSASSWR